MFEERLKLARKKEGLSLDALAEKIGHKVSKQALGKYERGEMMPSSDVLILLTKALNISLSFLFKNNVRELRELDFRKKSTTNKKDLDIVEAKTIDNIGRYLTIETILDMPSHSFNPPFEARSLSDDNEIEKLAIDLRSEWDLGIDGIIDLTETLEEKGIKVLVLDLPDKVSGFTCKALDNENNLIPIIIINKNHTLEHRRFTLAHELGHIFIKEDDEKLCEKKANHFAGAFLMPCDNLIREFGKNRKSISQAEIFELKRLYRVSAISTLYRLKQLSIISESAYKKVLFSYGKNWRTVEPCPLQDDAIETPKRFERLCYRALSEENISVSKASELLQKPIADILGAGC